MSENSLVKSTKSSEEVGTKNLKESALGHAPRSVLETKMEKFYPGPKLTVDSLRDIDTTALRLPVNGHEDYSYRWLSTDARAVPNLSDALGRKGYTMCSIEELPEMIGYTHKTLDNSLTDGYIVFKEMVLCKLHKDDLYLIMKNDHHDKPGGMAKDIYRGFNEKIAAVSKFVHQSTDAEVIANDRSGERRFVNGSLQSNDPEADGVISMGKDIRHVRAKFDI